MRIQINPQANLIIKKEWYCDLCKETFIVQTDLYNVNAKCQFLVEELSFRIHVLSCLNTRLEAFLGGKPDAYLHV